MLDSQMLRSCVFVLLPMRMLLLVALAVLPVAGRAEVDAPVAAVTPPEITIVRKSGHEDGVAQMVVKGKMRKITAHAVQAWPVRDGQGALILVVETKGSGPKQYLLRYYDLDTGRRRVLGAVPMRSGAVEESKGGTMIGHLR